MTFVKPQTRWQLEAWMLCPTAYKAALDARFQNNGNDGMGYGPNTFALPLSGSGSLPATAYHTGIMEIRIEDINQLVWLTSQPALSKMWVWLRARENVLTYLVAAYKQKLTDDLGGFHDVNWNTRTHCYIYLSETEIKPAAALAWLATNAVPAINLQSI